MRILEIIIHPDGFYVIRENGAEGAVCRTAQQAMAHTAAWLMGYAVERTWRRIARIRSRVVNNGSSREVRP